MNGDERVVVEQLSAAVRAYYWSHDMPACEMASMTAAVNASDDILQQMSEQNFASEMPDEAKRMLATGLAEKVASHTHECDFGDDLAEIESAAIRHEADRLMVSINPAKRDWHIVHKQVINTICTHLGVKNVDVELWQPGL